MELKEANQKLEHLLDEKTSQLQGIFENINDVTASIIVDEIIDSIERFEPRVELLQPDGVKAFPNYDNNTFDVIIGYTIIGTDVPAQQLEFVLESNR